MNEIRDIVEAMRACSRFHAENKKPGPGAPGRGAYLLRLHEIQQADADAHERALDVFAALNGWKITKRAFSPQRIGERTADFGCLSRPLFDHCKYFKAGGRNVAILTQPYGGVDFHEERRALNKIGLTLQRPPDPLASFHYPGWTMFLVLIAIEAPLVHWLPEQCGELAGGWQTSTGA